MSVPPDRRFRRIISVMVRVDPSAYPVASYLAILPFPVPAIIIPRSRFILGRVVIPVDVPFRSVMLLMHLLRVNLPRVIVGVGVVDVRTSVSDRRRLSGGLIFFRVAVNGSGCRGNVVVVSRGCDSVGPRVVPTEKRT